jgi:hypothetical protein
MTVSAFIGEMYRISLSDQGSTGVFPFPILFSGKVRNDWVINQPVPLVLERDEDDSYILSEDVFHIYGQGSSIDEAREDFIVALVEYYEILKKYADEDDASRELLEKFTQAWLPPA